MRNFKNYDELTKRDNTAKRGNTAKKDNTTNHYNYDVNGINEVMNEDRIEFASLGNLMMKEVNGKVIKEKFKLEEGLQLKKKLHEERVLWVKQKN